MIEQTDSLLTARLTAIAHLRRGYRIVAACLWALTGWLALALVIIVIDAAMALPVAASVVLLIVWLFALPMLAWWGWPERQNALREAMTDAQRLESVHRLGDTPLTNALTIDSGGCDVFAVALAQRTRHRGDERLETVDTTSVSRSDLPATAGAYFWLVVVLGLVMLMIQPGLVTSGLPRLIVPWGGVAPFSVTRIGVKWEPEQPFVGQNLQVQASVAGEIPEEAALVEFDEIGMPVRRLPMRQIAGGQFIYDIAGLDEPGTYHVESGSGRSEPFTIVPRVRPRMNSIAQSNGRSSPPPESDTAAGTSSRERAAVLAAQAATLRDQVQNMAQDGGSTAEMQRLRDAAATLAGLMRELAPQLDAEQQGVSNSLAEALADFASGHSQTIARLPQSTGLGQMLSEGGTTARTGPDEPPSDAQLNAAGAYDGIRNNREKVNTPDAVANQAPVMYRDIVQLYLERLANDEQRKE